MKRASANFAVDQEKLHGLIESAEKVKRFLQSAICLCGLEMIDAW